MATQCNFHHGEFAQTDLCEKWQNVALDQKLDLEVY